VRRRGQQPNGRTLAAAKSPADGGDEGQAGFQFESRSDGPAECRQSAPARGRGRMGQQETDARPRAHHRENLEVACRQSTRCFGDDARPASRTGAADSEQDQAAHAGHALGPPAALVGGGQDLGPRGFGPAEAPDPYGDAGVGERFHGARVQHLGPEMAEFRGFHVGQAVEEAHVARQLWIGAQDAVDILPQLESVGAEGSCHHGGAVIGTVAPEERHPAVLGTAEEAGDDGSRPRAYPGQETACQVSAHRRQEGRGALERVVGHDPDFIGIESFGIDPGIPEGEGQQQRRQALAVAQDMRARCGADLARACRPEQESLEFPHLGIQAAAGRPAQARRAHCLFQDVAVPAAEGAHQPGDRLLRRGAALEYLFELVGHALHGGNHDHFPGRVFADDPRCLHEGLAVAQAAAAHLHHLHGSPPSFPSGGRPAA